MKTILCCAVMVCLINFLDARKNSFRCDYTYFEEADGYLKYHEMPSDWHEAQLRCHMEGSVLASPINKPLRAAMERLANRSSVCGVFTGIHSRFSRGDFYSVEGVPLSKIPHNWAKDEPENEKDEEGCIAMLSDGSFAEFNCADTLPYICFKKVTPGMIMNSCGGNSCRTTDNGYNLDSRTGSCYKFHRYPRTWSRAYMTCSAEGGYLAIINSETEATVIKELCAKNTDIKGVNHDIKDVVNIGFHDWNEPGEWRTVHDGIHNNFRCDYYYNEEANGYFKFHEMPADWHEAQLRCHMEGSVLASPINKPMQTAILLYRTRDSAVFTGIHSKFSRGDFYSIEGVPLFKFTLRYSWASGEPDYNNKDERCIAMLSDGSFADFNCANTLPYMCYKKETPGMIMNACGTIDSAYKLDTRTGSCYKFHRHPRTWSRAYMTCSAEGGYLAIVNSETEAAVIRELFARNFNINGFGDYVRDVANIGFHDWNEHGEWRTIHGQTLSEAGYEKFSPGEANNNTGQYCGAILRSGLFDDMWCEKRAAFICEKDPEMLVNCP